MDNVASKARTLRIARSFHHDGDDDDTVKLVNGALIVEDAYQWMQWTVAPYTFEI
jgi:hypothetical protein